MAQGLESRAITTGVVMFPREPWLARAQDRPSAPTSRPETITTLSARIQMVYTPSPAGARTSQGNALAAATATWGPAHQTPGVRISTGVWRVQRTPGTDTRTRPPCERPKVANDHAPLLPDLLRSPRPGRLGLSHVQPGARRAVPPTPGGWR